MMRGPFRSIIFPLAFLTLSSCSGSDGDGNGATAGAAGMGTGGQGQGGQTACGAAVSASPANNYSFSSTLSFPPVAVAPGRELTFDWSAVTQDFVGHALDSRADVDTVNLMLWKLTESELQTKLNDDALAQRDLAVIASFFTEDTMATSAGLFEFTSVGMPLTPEMILPFLDDQAYDPASHIYTIMVATGTVLGQGTRMIQSFKLDPASSNTEVRVTSDSTKLEYSVDLRQLQPTRVPAGQADLSIDWADLTLNALGNPFVTTSITDVLVARYAQTPAELEADFLDLELIADDMWRGSVPSGSSIDLSSLMNEAGEPFAGIDGSGTWIVALTCGACRNPAPWYLSILKPCE